MFCDQETLPSCSVHMGFGINCPLAEYTMLKDVLNKKGLPKKKKMIVRVPPLPESMRMAEVLVICLQPSGSMPGMHLVTWASNAQDNRCPPALLLTW